jgi:hypothetical protein
MQCILEIRSRFIRFYQQKIIPAMGSWSRYPTELLQLVQENIQNNGGKMITYSGKMMRAGHELKREYPLIILDQGIFHRRKLAVCDAIHLLRKSAADPKT